MSYHAEPHIEAAIAAGAMRSSFSEDDALHPLKAVSTASRYARNQTIFNEGDKVRFSYKLLEGGVRLCKVRPDGRRQIAEFLLPGDVFGLEMSEEHSLTAEALGDVVVMRCPRNQLERLSDELPALRKTLMGMLCRELTAAQEHLVMLGRQTAKERVASFLLLIANRRNAADGEKIALPMGRQDIADYLGLTIETVCRALTDLKRERLIAIPDRHHVVVSDLTLLEEVAEGGDD